MMPIIDEKRPPSIDLDDGLLSKLHKLHKLHKLYDISESSQFLSSDNGTILVNESIIIKKASTLNGERLLSGLTLVVDIQAETIDDNENLVLFAPKKALEAVANAELGSEEPLKKRPRLRKSRNKVREGRIATIPDNCLPLGGVRAAILCSDLRKRQLPMARTYGPLLRIEPDGALTFCYAIEFLGDQVILKSSHQNLALRLIALASNDDSLLEPDKYQANPTELLRAITRDPSKSMDIPNDFEIPGLKTNLLPYQRESLLWCLRREGKDLIDNKVSDLDPSIRDFVVSPPLGWRQVPNSGIWVNPYLLRSLSKEPQPHALPDGSIYEGRGLLAEEMGLGKTVEMISLILLNQRPKLSETKYATSSRESQKVSSKATLVIMPKTILHQWASEVKLHAPELRTLILTTPNPPIRELSEADVVFVTYGQLSRWLPYMQTIRQRERRSNRANMLGTDAVDTNEAADDSYHHSTLIDVEFWRVVLDEVQMVHTGSSAAAQVARRIPRIHAWAASGTPVKHSLEDLRGITYFLDLKPFVERPCWQRLVSSPIDFEATMSLIAIRHTKSMVSDQLQLPKQHRRLVLLKFSAIEAARYNRVYQEFQKESVNPSCNWSSWLHRIRQICSHTAVAGGGASSGVAGTSHFGGNKLNGDSEVTAMTLDQILNQLIDDADSEVWSEQRDKLNLQLQLGQLYDISYQMPKALSEWKSVVNEVKSLLSTEKPRLDELTKQLKDRQSAIRDIESRVDSALNDSDSSDEEEASGDEDYKVKGNALMTADEQKDDTMALSEMRSKFLSESSYLKSSRMRCKSLQELLHRAYFFLGTGYFRSSKRMRISLGAEDIAKSSNQEIIEHNFKNETMYYELAEKIRNDILNQATERVNELTDEPNTLNLLNVKRVCRIPKSEVVDNLASFIEELMEKLRQILSEPLIEATPDPITTNTEGADQKIHEIKHKESTSSATDEPTGTEDAYSKTLDLQEYAFAYLEMLQVILRDRATAINGGNLQPRPTATFESVNSDISNKLLERREDIVSLLQYEKTPLTSLMKASGVKSQIINSLKLEVRKCQARYAVLRDLYNARVEYYRQLQDLSDQVTDIDVGTRTDYDQLILHKIHEINKSEHAIEKLLNNQSYLRNLSSSESEIPTKQEDGSSTDKEPIKPGQARCTICLEDIATGALTACLHYFCEDCLFKWIHVRHSCPLCNRPVKAEDVQTFRSGELPEDSALMKFETAADANHASDLYTPISSKLYRRIYTIPTVRSYGIKIDMIVRHAIYLRSKDPTEQIVVFSQWGTMLKILKQAFGENMIAAASTTSNNPTDINEFRTNPRVACLLLHAKADVAGLTLVNAGHVFLCEPLMNTSLELQAVSRINRIGQTRETTVWQFCVENTVEQTILGLTTQQRLAYIDQGQQNVAEDQDSAKMVYTSAKTNSLDRKSGEEVINDNNLIRRILIKD